AYVPIAINRTSASLHVRKRRWIPASAGTTRSIWAVMPAKAGIQRLCFFRFLEVSTSAGFNIFMFVLASRHASAHQLHARRVIRPVHLRVAIGARAGEQKARRARAG